jgi:hypothetical protein
MPLAADSVNTLKPVTTTVRLSIPEQVSEVFASQQLRPGRTFKNFPDAPGSVALLCRALFVVIHAPRPIRVLCDLRTFDAQRSSRRHWLYPRWKTGFRFY